jgi:hypothetical protein
METVSEHVHLYMNLMGHTVRVLMDLWWQSPLACSINKGAGLGARLTHAIHTTTWSPSRRRLSAELWSPSYVCGASTPTRGVPSLYMWTLLWCCYGCCCTDWLWPCGGCYRDEHMEETIVINYFLYTDARLRWIVTPTVLLLLSVSSGNDLWPLYLQVS